MTRTGQKKIVTGIAGVALALSITGCSYAGTSTGPVGAYWLIKVSGNNGNIYGYPAGYKPGPGASAEYLGTTEAEAHQYAGQAAKSLGITHVDTGIY
jgi:hypothetical protein